MKVGQLEKMLSKYPKNIEVYVMCNNCHRGTLGGDDLIKIKDHTNQDFRHIELWINNENMPDIGIRNKEEIYKRENKRFNDAIKESKENLKKYKKVIEEIENIIKNKDGF